MKIAKETWIIAAIGIADLVTTIVFIQHHGAQEANPLFRHYWEMGIPAFVIAKLVCLAGPLLVLEWARRSNPRFVARALRTAIAGYLSFYIVGYMQLNGPKAAAAEVAPQPSGQVYAMYEARIAQHNGLRFARIVGSVNAFPASWSFVGRRQLALSCRRMWKFAAPRLAEETCCTGPMGSFKSRLRPADD